MFHYKDLLICFSLSLFLLMGCGQTDNKQAETRPVQSIRVATLTDQTSLDPRKVRDLSSASVMGMLYEGLMRVDQNGELQPGLAESYSVSEDGQRYLFALRKAYWSNGDPITAEDFVYSWRSILSPSFPAPNAFQLFVIKNAEEAKNGSISEEKIAVHAIDDETLLVQLAKPVPYFLELTTFHPFFPINSKLDKTNPNWADGDGENVPSSGPFKIAKLQHGNQLVLEKNGSYYDADSVKLEQAILVTIEENTGFELFETGELDLTGSPLSNLPGDALVSLKNENKISTEPAAGTHWFRFNTKAFPFSHPKLRKAFSLALDRQALVDHILQGNQTPALGVVPSGKNWDKQVLFKDKNTKLARKYFREAIEELGIKKKDFPKITFSYGNTERHHRIAQAVQQQWQEAFGVSVDLQAYDGKVFYQKLQNLDYQIANGSWFADYRDPINFLEVFKSSENGTNNTGWENSVYRSLLDQSQTETNPAKRRLILQYAEEILVEEMPVAPLFFYTFNYLKKDNVKNVAISELGILNLREAYIENQDE